MANSGDPDQTAPRQSDLDLHCLLRPICPNIQNFYGNLVARILANDYIVCGVML